MNRETHIPSNLKFLRNSKGMTQEELGKICDKSNSAISNYEQGTREIEALDLIKIADYFGLTLDELIAKDLRLNNNQSEYELEQKQLTIQEAKNEIENIIKNSDMTEQQKQMVMMPLNYISEENNKEVKKDEK